MLTTDLVREMRTLADLLEKLDTEQPLPPVSVSLGVQIVALPGPSESERIAAVDRINGAMGHESVLDGNLYRCPGFMRGAYTAAPLAAARALLAGAAS